ncbi:unnamed protein product [Prunus brigantina]
MEKWLSRMENDMVEFNQRLEEDVLMKEGFGIVVEELQGQFQRALNSALDSINLDVQTQLDHFMAELTALRDEMKDVKGDWALCKEVVLNKTRTPKEPKVLDSFKPKSYNGKREAKQLDTFLWNIERYFKYLKIEDDEPKINTATSTKKKALNAMNQEKKEEADMEAGMGAIHHFNIVQAKVAQPQVQAKRVMFVDAMVNGKTTHYLVDTGALHNFMSMQEVKRLGCRVSKEAGSMKTVNSTAKPIDGVARGVELHIATWNGVVDFSVISMDDYDVMLGMEFMDKVKAFPIPFYNSMCIAQGGAMSCMVLMVRQQGESKPLSAMQFSKSWKKGEPTFLATMNMDIVDKEVQPVPKAVKAVLKEFADVMPNELPKTLPPKREVDHAIELEPSAKSPAKAQYRMTPLKLEELRRQLKQLPKSCSRRK